MASVQSILNTASQYLGTKDFNNFCEAFVEQAIQAWIAQQKNSVQGTQGIQPGDTVYFAADKSNGGYGHTGIYIGNNQFISATYNGVKTANLSQWQQSTGQKLLGYVPSGQSGRGVAQFAMSNGKMLNSQMTEASQTPDMQMQQKLQDFLSQQHIAQSERLMTQQRAQQLGDQSQQFAQTLQQTKQQQVPNLSVIPQQSQQSQNPVYPYGGYLNQTTPTPTAPSIQSQANIPQATPPPTLPGSTSTDFSKPQINLNPAQQQTQQ
jgi:hypothetical protein